MGYPVVAVAQLGRAPIYLSIRGPLDLGRECEGLLLEDPQVSRRHLRLDHVEGRVVVTDLGSSNGTLLDDQPLTTPVPLSVTTVVTLGSTTITLVDDEADAGVDGDDGSVATTPAPPVDPRRSASRAH